MATRLVPPGADERWVDTASGRLRVLHAGDPTEHDPIMLIHGGGTDNAAISWFRLLEPLSADREVWAIDLPGFGGSIDLPPVGGPVAMASVVADLMECLDLARVVVTGVSMGGDVALNLALRHPTVVAGLVLIAPGGLVPRLGGHAVQFLAWLATQSPDWLLLPAARFANRFVKAALHAIVVDPTTLPDEVVAEFVREARDRRGGLAYGRYNQATLGRTGMLNDLSSEVERIRVPVLLFHGEADPMVDPEGSRRAADQISGARLVMVPQCGHWAQLEAHDRFLVETRTFLDQLDEPTEDDSR